MSDNIKNERHIWLGVFFVLLGGVWLLDNLDLIPYSIAYYLISWQSFLVLLGLYFIIGRKKIEPGIVLVAIGSFFILEDMHLFHIRNMWHLFWPIVIITAGVSLILRRSKYKSVDSPQDRNDINYLDDFAILGGREVKVDTQNFRGGKITALFGGSTIDLRKANLSAEQNVIDVFAMFGGTSIIVPPEWTVHVDVFSILGGFGDRRASPVQIVPDKEKVLIIKGFVMFGGGDVKLTR